MNYQKYNSTIIGILSFLLILSIIFIAISFNTNNVYWVSTLLKQEPANLTVYQQYDAVAGQLIYKNAYDILFSAESDYKEVTLSFKMQDENNNIFYEEKIIFENSQKEERCCKTHYVSTEDMLKAKRVWCELVSYY